MSDFKSSVHIKLFNPQNNSYDVEHHCDLHFTDRKTKAQRS